MTLTLLLFDMDGVLLQPLGYHQALQDTVQRVGASLGAPQTVLTMDQIAKFEALGVTSEWDSLAICTALILVNIWQEHPNLRLKTTLQPSRTIFKACPDFDTFLDQFTMNGPLPCTAAFDVLDKTHPTLSVDQKTHLRQILFNNRNIHQSPIMALFQETVLGSAVFQDNYSLAPQLELESYLLTYDRPVMGESQRQDLIDWLEKPDHLAGIMTNRPSSTPPGYLSAPEAELGAKLVGLDHLPVLGSGLLAWAAVTLFDQPDHLLLKPHPVHALALMQICLGMSRVDALKAAFQLWQGQGDITVWEKLTGARVLIFEDAAKGLTAGIQAKALLEKKGIPIQLEKLGVSDHPAKIKALASLSDQILPNLNHFNWKQL